MSDARSPAGTFNLLLSLGLWFSLILTFVPLLAMLIVLLSVVPKFEEMFADFETELPGITILVLNISAFLRSHYIISTLIGFSIAAALAAPFVLAPENPKKLALLYMIIAWLLLSLMVALIVIALFLPLINLMAGMSQAPAG